MDKKLKYYDLMEDLRKQIVSGKIKPVSYTHLTLPTICSV